jgi:hypothetical protein
MIISFLKQDLSQLSVLEDLFSLVRLEDDHDLNEIVKKHALSNVRNDFSLEMESLYKRCLLFDAKDKFDDFLLYVEFDREPHEKFYVPRYKILSPVVADLQLLATGGLDIFALSMPPGTGKSTLGMFFIAWLMLRNPKRPNAMAAYSGGLTKRFYQRLLNIFEDKITYHWQDVFPNLKVKTNAEEKTIDILPIGNSNHKLANDFPSTTCRGADGAWTGNIRVEQCLYCDDLIEGIEEAISPIRLLSKYNKYATQMKDRKKEGSFELHIGTRWAVHDVTGRIFEQHQDNPRVKFTNIPALDENGESNFFYPFNLGFSTEFFLDIKESIDEADWEAKYCGVPFLRDGLLLPADEVQHFNGVLPDGDPDNKMSWCDVAWGGGDFLSMPFGELYGTALYVTDWIYNKGDKSITKPLVTGRLMKHLPYTTGFEADNGGHEYSDSIDLGLKADNIRLNIVSYKAGSKKSKEGRIMTYAPEIRSIYFLDYANSSQEYRQAMRDLTTYSPSGKNPHDDAPDSLAGLIMLLLGVRVAKVSALPPQW